MKPALLACPEPRCDWQSEEFDDRIRTNGSIKAYDDFHRHYKDKHPMPSPLVLYPS